MKNPPPIIDNPAELVVFCPHCNLETKIPPETLLEEKSPSHRYEVTPGGKIIHLNCPACGGVVIRRR